MPALASFHDVRFPLPVAFGATGGPERRVEIVALASGREKRNLRQAHALRRYDAGTGLRSLADIEAVLAFFEARLGSLHAFRFRDPFDWKTAAHGAAVTAADQMIGTGDGTTTDFPLTKTYGSGPATYTRPIACAIASTLRVSVDGVEKPAAAFSMTGGGSGVRFASGHVPATGQSVRAGFEFDVPVRFDTDALSLSISGFMAGQVQSIPLKEVLL
jgi:uncharacterized protein (TIGR02217 family)